jgi:threonine dehydrogenase-like Zn-dependent dehydrogenase
VTADADAGLRLHARRVAAMVPPDAAAEVTGDGPLAALVADLLRGRMGGGDDGPDAIVETTGRPEAIGNAIARLADDGLLVLAGAPDGADVTLDPYTDLHRRSLRVAGIAPPPPDGGARPSRVVPPIRKEA